LRKRKTVCTTHLNTQFTIQTTQYYDTSNTTNRCIDKLPLVRATTTAKPVANNNQLTRRYRNSAVRNSPPFPSPPLPTPDRLNPRCRPNPLPTARTYNSTNTMNSATSTTTPSEPMPADSPRKLSDLQSSELRSLLHLELQQSNPQIDDVIDDEDAPDLLDYALVMVTNGKAVSYIVSELEKLEMDICSNETAGRIGSGIGTYLQSTPVVELPPPAQNNITPSLV